MGGRRPSSGKAPTPAPPPTPAPQPTPTPIPQPQPPPKPKPKPNPFPPKDNSPFHTLADEDGYYKKQKFDAQSKAAITGYLDPHAVPGTLYSPSQILNHAMREGKPLTQRQKQMRDGLMKGMHNLGENMEMTRYCRVGFMADLGCANFSRMSITTLQRRLVGRTYVDNAFLSASCNNFKKAPRGNPFTDKAIKLNIKAPASAKALMPGAGKGGDFGEFIFAPGQHYRITGARWTGKQGRSGANYYKQIELDVEMY